MADRPPEQDPPPVPPVRPPPAPVDHQSTGNVKLGLVMVLTLFLNAVLSWGMNYAMTSRLDARFETIESRVTEASTAVTNLANRMSDVVSLAKDAQADVTMMEATMSTVQKTQEETTDTVENLAVRVSDVEAFRKSTQSVVTKLEANLSTAQQTQQETADTVTACVLDVEALRQEMDTAVNKQNDLLEATQSTVLTVEETQAKTSTTVSALEATVATHTKSLDASSSHIVALQRNVTSLDQTLADLSSTRTVEVDPDGSQDSDPWEMAVESVSRKVNTVESELRSVSEDVTALRTSTTVLNELVPGAPKARHEGWVALVSEAVYYGQERKNKDWVAEWHAPEAHGQFSEIRVEYLSGAISANRDETSYTFYPWQQHAYFVSAGFELKRLRDGTETYLLEQPAWGQAAKELGGGGRCVSPPRTHPTDDVVCSIALDVRDGDKLKATWYRPSHNMEADNNSGVLRVRIWAKPS